MSRSAGDNRVGAHRGDHFGRCVADARVASGNHEYAITQVDGRVGKIGSHGNLMLLWRYEARRVAVTDFPHLVVSYTSAIIGP